MRRCTHKMMIQKIMHDFQRRGSSAVNLIGNETVTSRLRNMAIGGDAAAQYRMGCCYAEGLGVEPDGATARMWFKASADGGHVPAMFCLGQALFHGDGLNVNRTQGLHWLMKAANRGSLQACHTLGVSFFNGDNLPRRFDLAVKWFRKAANWGCTGSMMRLGNCYRHGLGVEQNPIAAYVCMIVASKRTAMLRGSMFRWRGFEELTDEQRAEVRRLSETMVNGNLDF